MEFTKESIIGENRLSKQDKITLFENLLMSVGDRKGINELLDFIRRTDFYTAPASSRYHSNYEGGLLDHVLIVYLLAKTIADDIYKIDSSLSQSITKENIIIASLLHDICKVCLYHSNEKWRKEGHQWVSYMGYELEDTFPIGHGEKSVIMLQNIGLELLPCEMLAIRYHMGFWNENGPEVFASQKSAMKMCPLVTIIQMADFVASVNIEKTI